MSITSAFTQSLAAVQSHSEFLALISDRRTTRQSRAPRPPVSRPGRGHCRGGWPRPLRATVRLNARGKNPLRDFPSALVAYAVLHAKGRPPDQQPQQHDRRFLSPLAHRSGASKVEPLPAFPGIARDRLNSDGRPAPA